MAPKGALMIAPMERGIKAGRYRYPSAKGVVQLSKVGTIIISAPISATIRVARDEDPIACLRGK